MLVMDLKMSLARSELEFLIRPEASYHTPNGMIVLGVIYWDFGCETLKMHRKHPGSFRIAGIRFLRMLQKASRLSLWSLLFVRILDLEQ